jgi:hypothetical protein
MCLSENLLFFPCHFYEMYVIVLENALRDKPVFEITY